MKKNWNNPNLKKANINATNEQVPFTTCPLEDTQPSHGIGPFRCKHECKTCGNCKALPGLCPINWVIPVEKRCRCSGDNIVPVS